MSKILCIEQEPAHYLLLEGALGRIGYQAVHASCLEEALKAVGRESFDLVISSPRLADGDEGNLMDLLKRKGSDIPVIFMSPDADSNGPSSMEKPLRFEALRVAVDNALEICNLRRDAEDVPRRLIGESRALRDVLDTLAAVAPTRATVLMEGESGTGKELLVRALHELSPRAGQAFVAINCAALPEGLVESTLFGHERGAFTGASAKFIGAFERAHKGTLLLDEISELRLDLQGKLLRAIQEQQFERVGGSRPVQVDVRIVATTNRHLLSEVNAGRFRRDLYYRLRVVPIRVPSLRERLEDIPLLVRYFVERSARETGVQAPEVPEETMVALQDLSWPGNIRELEHAVERAVILRRKGPLLPEAFLLDRWCQDESVPNTMQGSDPVEAGQSPAGGSLNLKTLERHAIERALAATGGNRIRAAQLLGISDRTLRNKLNGKSASREDAGKDARTASA
jgi:DNA-binding NtrC family response regulator